jgi:hypothetical protein
MDDPLLIQSGAVSQNYHVLVDWSLMAEDSLNCKRKLKFENVLKMRQQQS